MKKIISIILSVLMLFSMGISPIQAVSSEIIAEISKVSVLPGGKAEVFINLKCNSGIKTLSFIDFIYDDSVLTLIESECAWLADGIIEDIDFENDASIITFGNNTSFDGNIFKLVFEVSEDVELGSFPVSCDVIGTRMIDKVETRIDISITAGEILVVDSTTTLSDFDYELTSDGIVITGYKGNKTNVIISETYEVDGASYDVVGIAESAFEANEHNWDNGVIDPVSTCKTHGVKAYTCQNDTTHKRSEQVALDGNNHEGGTEIINSVEANCGEAGYTGDTYCLGCNTKIADGKEIPATGDHTYGNWVVDETDTKKMSRTCTVCGDVEESAVYLAGRSLLFKDIIQIRYYFDFSRFGDDVKSTGLLIWSEDEYKATDVHDINTAPYKMTNMTKRGNSDMYYGESAGVPAKNMIDNQYAIAYAELKNGTIEYTETCTFSPVVYCQTILAEGGNFEATMKNLAAALMNYGAAAQLHFKYKTDTLMNAWMADYLKEVAFDEALIQALPEIDDSKFTLTNDENIRKIGSSLTFVGNIMQNMYFDIENDDIANAREVKLLYWTESEYNKLDSLSYANARKAELVYDQANSNKTGINCYRTVLEGVSAKDLRGAFMFVVYYKDAEGNEFYGPLFADGAHDYVRRVLITNTAATMKNLAKAFFMYHIAAEKHLLK